MDCGLMKKIVCATVIGCAVGAAGTICLVQMGLSLPVVAVLMIAGLSACGYLEVKATQKRQADSWQEAYKAGAEAALKGK